MCSPKVDEFGRPVDPVLEELEWNLCSPACDWAANLADPERQEEIVREYHITITKLYSLGWDGAVDFKCALPDKFMPEEYRCRNPRPPNDIWQRRD